MNKKPPISTRYNEVMYEDFYTRISAPWRTMRNGRTVLTAIDKGLRVLFVSLYGLLLIWLVATQSNLLIRAMLVPLITFCVVSLWRSGINWQRPYERYNIDPLIRKDTQGKSMPSRHMASASIITCTLLWVAGNENHPIIWSAAIIGFLGCGAIAYVRIVGGVHFPRDIAVAAVAAITAAAVGFLV